MQKFLKVVSMLTLLIFLRTGFALAAEQVYFYYNDPAGTPLAMSDATGTVVWRADYLPFGEETIDLSTVQNNKMFVGKEKDSESGLYYFGARYMDPTAGRFISPDLVEPINIMTGKVNDKFLLNPQRLNRYAYAGNNPYAFVDPDGLDWYYAITNGHLVYSNPAGQTIKFIDLGNVGTSGKSLGRNNPDKQGEINVGPIVTGTYQIGDMTSHVFTLSNGKQVTLQNVMSLEPDGPTAILIQNIGRTGGFWLHPLLGNGTNGCIGMSDDLRSLVNDIIYSTEGDDRTLHVERDDSNFTNLRKEVAGSNGE